MVVPLMVPIIARELLKAIAVSFASSVITKELTGSFDKSSQEICTCLAVLDESVKQVRDAVLGRDVEKQSDTRGLCCG